MEENKYKDALERAKSAIKECGDNVGRIKMIESIFPDELGGSEDERIRKDLISHLKHECLVKKNVSDVEYDKWIAWLEKQGKHKFNIGDTISNGDIEYRVVDIVKNCVYNDCYSLRRAGKIEEPFLWDCEEADKLFEKL